jgi:hypothetical protein
MPCTANTPSAAWTASTGKGSEAAGVSNPIFIRSFQLTCLATLDDRSRRSVYSVWENLTGLRRQLSSLITPRPTLGPYS